MKSKKILIIILLSIIYSIGCNPKIENKSRDLYSSYEPIKQQKVDFTDEYLVYDPFKALEQKKPFFKKKPNYRTYAYIDVSCSNCLDDLQKWSEMRKWPDGELTEFRVVCFSKDNFLYFRFLYEQGRIKKVNFPFYFDPNLNFSKNNSFFSTSSKNPLILTDLNNNILAVGDPFENIDDRKVFTAKLSNTRQQKQ
jgi:hypothetical protein